MRQISTEPGVRRRGFAIEHAGLFVASALFLTILAPFGTDTDLTGPVRLCYWTVAILGGALITRAFSGVIARCINPRISSRRTLATSIQVLAVSVPITLLVGGLEAWLREPMSATELLRIYPYVLSIAIVVTSVSALLRRYRALSDIVADRQPVIGKATSTKGRPVTARFSQRLSPRFRSEEIILIKAEDHYLHVQTRKGTEVIRCNLSTAVEELAGVDGQRIHRSFWVARSAICSVNKHGTAYRITLQDQSTVPLSRRRYQELTACGWLETG